MTPHTGAVGAVRRDPMAMLPFIGHDAGDDVGHWIDVGDRPRADAEGWRTELDGLRARLGTERATPPYAVPTRGPVHGRGPRRGALWEDHAHTGRGERPGGDVGTSDAEDRALFETAGTALYEEIVSSGGIVAGEPRVVAGGDLHDAFEQLREMGLVRLDPDNDRWVAEDPGLVHGRVVAPLSQQGALLLEESLRWAEALNTVSQTWRKAPEASERGPFRYLHGDTINAFLGTLGAEAEEEVLTAQPQSGRDTGKGLEESLQMERALLERGVRILTLYQHSARRSTATREYVAALSPLGAEVRTQDEFFNRMIVVDRRTAIIPSPQDLKIALAIREPTIVAYLVDVFMRSWERARPFTSQEASVVKHIADEQRAMTMRMLIEGHSDPVSAKRLGVSPRTYAGYVADLKEEFDAETRFQLGYSLGRLGLRAEADPAGDGIGED